MSDIFKRLQGQKNIEPRPQDKEESGQKELPQIPPSSDSKEPQPANQQFAKAMKELEPDKERIRALYFAGLHLAKDVLKSIKEETPLNLNKVKTIIEEITDLLILKDKELLNLFYEYSPENYLYSHMINVTIMSIEVGLGMGHNKSKLHELGLAAYLHDVGMAKLEDIYLQPRKLTQEEYNKIKEHSIYSFDILSRIEGVPESVITATRDLHERANGKGYPSGLEGGEISEYSRIIATVDTYEALTHNRVYRNKFPPHEAIKEMLTSGYLLYDHEVLKILVNQVGIYPIGSWVELNTDEVGKVITVNEDFPLRPVVNILFDKTKDRLKDSKVINLAKQTNIHIKRPLSDKEILEQLKGSGN
jgi:HD-GYP domain-containing protein (c-di-GMP phosphodiesterase class II)